MKSRTTIFLSVSMPVLLTVAGIVAWFQIKDQGKIDWHFCIGFSLALAIIGGAIAVIALPITREVEAKEPPRKLLGLRIGTVGFLVVFFGGAIAFTASFKIGYWICVAGSIPFFTGILIHIYNLLFYHNK